MSTQPIPVGEEITGAITKHMDRRFLSSIDLAGQGVVNLTIERIEKHPVLQYSNGQKATNAILCYFKEVNRPLVLKTTHIKEIIKRTKTNNVNDWIGTKVPFEAREEKCFGEMQMCVRVAKGGAA